MVIKVGIGTRRVALYARASSDAQEHSTSGQLRDLRLHADREGFEVVEEIEDVGEKRHTIERPGVMRLRDLCEDGQISEVWAWAWDRYGEFPMPELLAREFEDYGVVLRSLDDGGGGDSSYEMTAIKSLFSRQEQKSRVRRASRGRRDKARRGEVFGGHRPRYGLRFVRATGRQGREVNVGYEIDPEKMAVVASIFESVAAGQSLKAVRRRLQDSEVPNPSGGPRWSTTSLRNIVLDDIYRPHSAEEVRALLTHEQVVNVDEHKDYGIHWSGRMRSRYKANGGKRRVVYETPREEWVPIPIDLTGSGLDRHTVDLARTRVFENRPLAAVGDRIWGLSGGVLRCATCGRSMIAYRRARSSGGYLHYYRCRPSNPADACENRKSHGAEWLEHQAAHMFGFTASRETLEALYEEALEREALQTGASGALERQAALTEEISELHQERMGYLRQNARGAISDAELDELLSDLDRRREDLDAALREAEGAAEAARRVESLRQPYLSDEWYLDPDAVHPTDYLSEVGGIEEALRTYQRLGARFEVDPSGSLTLRLDLTPELLRLTSTCS